MQIYRLFEMVYILLDKKSITAGELAKHFGVSRRTIGRDIETLSIAGIPIYTERGRGGGVSLLPNFVLNKSLITDKEQNEILSALYGLSSIKGEDTEKTLKKLSSVFNKKTADWLKVDLAGWSHENDFFSEFKTAIEKGLIVEFDYYNRYGDKTQRRVWPIQVWFKSRAWYLKGFCLKKNGVRLYKVSRIKNLVVTDEVFEERDLPVPEEETDLKSADKQNAVTIKLRIGPERAYRVYDDFYESMVAKQPDGSFIVTLSTDFWPEDNWLYGFILSFGKYIEVIEPEHIRQVIKEEALEISNKYL